MVANIAMMVFVLIAAGSALIIFFHPERVVDGFRELARAMYPERVVQKVYTTRGVVTAGCAFMAFALLCLGILVWRLMNGYGLS